MASSFFQFNNNTVYVYWAKFDKTVAVKPVQPAIRNEAIERCTDTLTRQQRYCVWALLDYALKQRCGKGVDAFDFDVATNGKWTSNAKARFSLSHSDEVVVVAISDQEVGVDIEAVSSFSGKFDDEAFVNRVLNNAEYQQFSLRPLAERQQTLAILWTRKESVFKLDGGSFFSPRSIDTTARQADSRLLEVDGKSYALSVATRNPITIEVNQVNLW